MIPPDVMLHKGRLLELLQRALSSQMERSAQYKNQASTPVSLLRDYRAGVEQLPTLCTQVVQTPSSQVWHIAFSPNGRWLLTSCSQGLVKLWQVRVWRSHMLLPSSWLLYLRQRGQAA